MVALSCLQAPSFLINQTKKKENGMMGVALGRNDSVANLDMAVSDERNHAEPPQSFQPQHAVEMTHVVPPQPIPPQDAGEKTYAGRPLLSGSRENYESKDEDALGKERGIDTGDADGIKANARF